MSKFIHEFFDKLMEESKELGNHTIQVDEIQTKSIDEFKKAYEEHSKSDAEKLIADITSLVSNHICRQKEMVDARLTTIRETATGSKKVLDGHVLSIDRITSVAKRKLEDFSMQAETDAKENADFAAAKHCRIESLLQKWSASDSNEHHDAEINSLRVTAEDDVLKTSEDILIHMDGTIGQEKEIISAVMEKTRSQAKNLESLHEDHARQSVSIKLKANDTFQHKYMDYEPSGNTPLRSDADVPSKVTIESLRAMPVENLLEEFRENHSFESFAGKSQRPLPLYAHHWHKSIKNNG